MSENSPRQFRQVAAGTARYDIHDLDDFQVVHVRSTGVVDLTTFMDLTNREYSDPKITRRWTEILDARFIEKVDLSVRDIWSIATIFKNVPKHLAEERCIIVTGASAAIYGLARMYQSVCEGLALNIAIHIVDDIKAVDLILKADVVSRLLA